MEIPVAADGAPPPLAAGDRVHIARMKIDGTVRIFGKTQFAAGVWVGVEIDKAEGKNNGTVAGVKYFECEDNYGVFVRPAACDKIEGKPSVSALTASAVANHDRLVSPRGGLSPRAPSPAPPPRSIEETELASTFATGQRLIMFGQTGTVRFVGEPKFASGLWVGIEFDEPVGSHAGSVAGVSYFQCPPNHGIFVQPPQVGQEALLSLGRRKTVAALPDVKSGGRVSICRTTTENPGGASSPSSRRRGLSMASSAAGDNDEIIVSSNSDDYTVVGPDGSPIDVEELVEAFQELEEEADTLKRELLQAQTREAALRAELAYAQEGLDRHRANTMATKGEDEDDDDEGDEIVDLTDYWESY